MKHLLAGLFISIVALLIVHAQVPNLISYQGLMTLPSGAPVANGAYDIKFELFDVPSSGSALWSETQSGISVHSGTFTVSLGSVSPLPGIFGQPVYIQVTALAGPSVSSQTVFARTLLTSTPYSLSLRLPYSGTSSQPASTPAFIVSNSGAGTGIAGIHDSIGGADPGLFGVTNATGLGAMAVEGVVTSSSPGSYSTAVRGMNDGTGSSGIGVYGSHNGSGWGVYGYVPAGIGVFGSSSTGHGIVGTSASSIGVMGSSGTNYGMYGYSPTSVGVYGYSDSGEAVYGYGRTSHGVYGVSLSGDGVTGTSGSGYGVISLGKFRVSSLAGDSSVQLPNNAVNSQEILDEPGIAVEALYGFFILSNTTANQLADSVTINVPDAGKVIVEVNGYAGVTHTNGSGDDIIFQVLANPTGNALIPGVSNFNVPSAAPSATYHFPVACRNIFNVTGATSLKLYLVVHQYSGASIGSSWIGYPMMQATFYPTAYGNTPVADVSPFSANASSPSAGVAPAQVTYQTPEEFNAEKTASLRQNIQDLQNRIDRLEMIIRAPLNTGNQSIPHQ